MYVHRHIGACVCKCACTCTYMLVGGGQRSTASVVPPDPSTLLPEIGYSHWDLALDHSPRLAGQLVPAILLSPLPPHWDYKGTLASPDFHSEAGN